MAYHKPPVTPEMQAERDINHTNRVRRLSPAARYWPAKATIYPPTLPDGSLDVRAWLAQLDKACNEAVTPC